MSGKPSKAARALTRRSSKAPSSGRVVTRRKQKDEITTPYPTGKTPAWDDEPTLVADPIEMQMTAQAMMFVDTGH
jgi:hypothetical protein